MAIPSICEPGDVTYVMTSRETERFVNEIHTLEARIRSGGELLENLQESKESMLYEQREVTSSPEEILVALSIGETRAGFVKLVPTKAFIHTRKMISRNEKKVITIHANPKRGSDWQSLYSKQSQQCYVNSIKTNESLMDQDTGKQFNPYC